MIVNAVAAHPTMSKTEQPQDNPPAYDSAVESAKEYDSDAHGSRPQSSPIVPVMTVGPSYSLQSSTGSPIVYNYVKPQTGERVVSLLPPDHPEMICLQEGEHITYSNFGILGVLAAVFWFPLGVGLCLLDRQVKCRRCGAIVEPGICH